MCNQNTDSIATFRRRQSKSRNYRSDHSNSEIGGQNLKLIMTLLLRNEADIVRHNIDFHLACGVDHVIATDNASVDGTREILSEYERKGILTLIDEPVHDYSQYRWVTHMALMARDQFDADWIINNDSDEFWLAPDSDLKKSIEGREADILQCQRRNMTYAYDDDDPLPWHEKAYYRIANPTPIPALGDRFRDPLPNPYFFLALPGKALLRAKSLRAVHQGNHGADYDREPITIQSDIVVYHYPLRSKAQFESKIRQGGEAYAANQELPETIGWHKRRWYRMLLEHGLETAIADALPCQRDIESKLISGEVVPDRGPFSSNLC